MSIVSASGRNAKVLLLLIVIVAAIVFGVTFGVIRPQNENKTKSNESDNLRAVNPPGTPFGALVKSTEPMLSLSTSPSINPSKVSQSDDTNISANFMPSDYASNMTVSSKSPSITPFSLKPTTLEPSTFEPSTLRPSTLEPSTLEPSTLEPSTLEPSTLEPSTLEPSTLKPTTLEPSTLKPTTFEPSTLEPSTLEPSTLKPTTFEPSTLEPSTLEPSKAGKTYIPSKRASFLPSFTSTVVPTVPLTISGTSNPSNINHTSFPSNQHDENMSSPVPSSVSECMIGYELFTFNLTTDKYPGETSWTLTFGAGSPYAGILALFVDIYYKPTTQFVTQECLPLDCYVLNVLDSYGDGIFSPGEFSYSFAGFSATHSPATFTYSFQIEFGTCGTALPTPTPGVKQFGFNIQLENMGIETAYDEAFRKAKSRWEEIIIGDLPDIPRQASFSHDWFNGYWEGKRVNVPVDDVIIGYDFLDTLDEIDSNGDTYNILGLAGPIYYRNSELPSKVTVVSGIMLFDSGDFAQTEQSDLELIILHEMGHVLGIGSLFDIRCGVDCAEKNNVTYTCDSAKAEYDALNVGDTLELESEVCGHWAESNFLHNTKSELMTPYFEDGKYQPVSRVSVGSLKDLGYEVNMDAADPWDEESRRLEKKVALSTRAMPVPTKSFYLTESMILRPEKVGFN